MAFSTGATRGGNVRACVHERECVPAVFNIPTHMLGDGIVLISDVVVWFTICFVGPPPP